MIRASRVLQLPTERTWSWAPFKKAREIAKFPALKVIFCGSDHFSVPSFTMLRELHLRHNDIISELAVITPSDKKSGRGMATLKSTPMTILARRMNYTPTHVSSFNMTVQDLPPGAWDLLIAVSFGHKISAAVLDRMTYGGLNVHPSLLPRYRGPAPLHHALLNNDQVTGVSIQTLHPTKFDQGDVLMQSDPISLEGVSLDCLNTKSARLGADMLRALLTRGYPANAPACISSELEPSYAPKIHKDEMEIQWKSWPAAKIVRWSATLNALWTRVGDKVVKVNDLKELDGSSYFDLPIAAGTASMVEVEDGNKALLVKCIDGYVSIGRLTLAGKKEKLGSQAQELHGLHLGI